MYNQINKKKRILLVGDNENVLSIFKHIFTSYGFHIKTHSTGLNVPEIVMRYHPNIILIERGLADRLDMEVCIELNQIHNHLPVILFSAEVKQENSFDVCTEHEFLQKPFEIENLIDTINLHLN